jgi:hypothetical protein
MFSIRFCALLCTLSLLVGPGSCIIRCSSIDNFTRSLGVPLIDGQFEDCGFEGPLMGDYGDDSPISEMTFQFDKSNLAELWLNFLISPRADPERFNRDSVREITLKGNNWAGNLPLVEHAFSKMHGLEKVHWEIREPVTDNILRSLERNNPTARLYYSFHNWSWKPNSSLVNSTLLYSLKADISYGYYAEYELFDFLFETLSNASNVRELDLFLHADGCELGVGNPWAIPFSTHPSARFPPLEVLRLDGYALDERSDGGMAWAWRGKIEKWKADWEKWLEYDDDDEEKKPPFPERPEDDGRTNLEAWMDAMDWSNLHTLHLGSPSSATLHRLRSPALPALKHISINAPFGWAEAATQDEILSFVTNGTPNLLHSITLQNMGAESGDELLQTLISSPNLTQELRHFSYAGGGENIFFLNHTKLSDLLAKSPSLEHLDINVPRDFDMSIEGKRLFHDIISTPTVSHLTLRIPSPDEHFMAPGREWEWSWGQIHDKSTGIYDQPDPLINLDTATNLFSDIRAKKEGAELKELEFYVGDWENRVSMGMIQNNPLRVAHWRCTLIKGCQGEQTRMS